MHAVRINYYYPFWHFSNWIKVLYFGVLVTWRKAIWQNINPLKVRILMWLVVQNKHLLLLIWAREILLFAQQVFSVIDIMKQLIICFSWPNIGVIWSLFKDCFKVRGRPKPLYDWWLTGEGSALHELVQTGITYTHASVGVVVRLREELSLVK